MSKIVKTWYEIRIVTPDGLIKTPQTWGYGQAFGRFEGRYDTPAKVDEAILEHGETYEEYVMLTMKQAEEVDETS